MIARPRPSHGAQVYHGERVAAREGLPVLERCQAALAVNPGARRTARVIKIDDRIGVEGDDMDREVESNTRSLALPSERPLARQPRPITESISAAMQGVPRGDYRLAGSERA
jgi:hypothetical protein